MSEASDGNDQRFLIYASGYPEEGQKLTEMELQSELSAGHLLSSDLVWVDGVWRQLSDIFELEPYVLPDCSDPSEPEFAVRFKELPSSAIRSRGDLVQDGKAPIWERSGLLRHMIFHKGHRRPFWQLVTLFALLGIILVAGVLYGLIPSFNWLLWRPAHVLVINPYPTTCELTFEGQTYTLRGNGHVTIQDIFGRMPRTETLLFKHPNEKQAKIIHVPLKGAETVLVNPMGMMFFGVVRTDLKAPSISSGLRSQLVAQVSGGKIPESAVTIADSLKVHGGKVLLTQSDAPFIYTNDPVVQEGQLNFDQLGLERSQEDLERGDQPVEVQKGSLSRNLLRGVMVGEARLHYRKGGNDVAECRFPVTFPKTSRPPLQPVLRFGKSCPVELRSFEALGGSAQCGVAYHEKETVVTVRFSKPDYAVVRNQRRLLGRWEYEARKNLKTGRWSWSWHFTGHDRIKVGFLELSVDDKGVIRMDYKEHRNP